MSSLEARGLRPRRDARAVFLTAGLGFQRPVKRNSATERRLSLHAASVTVGHPFPGSDFIALRLEVRIFDSCMQDPPTTVLRADRLHSSISPLIVLAL